MQKTQIAPSLLAADFGHLATEITALENAGADILHLDIMDGHYVPNLSFGFPLLKTIRNLTSLPLDVHLMVTNPDFHIPLLLNMGVQWVSFHQETCYHSHRLIGILKEKGIKTGLALNPSTPIGTLEAILPDLDYVLVMSVNPGFAAQDFIPSAIYKIWDLFNLRKKNNYRFLIEVDGGITASNAKALKEAGADILVSASYIFKSEDYNQAIAALKNA
ncbi:MAG: ribulose-phosphate 3-epimerase [Candidatus Cloacimonas sp.]